jgi:predicted RNase H-like HicB family nuclease
MKEQLTAVFQKVPERYIAFVEELPEAHSQSETLDEARSNLRHAVQLVPSDPVSSGMTLTVLPSTTHSSVVLGPIFSFFRTSDGTETCPRLVILVRISGGLQCSDYYCKPKDSLSCK